MGKNAYSDQKKLLLELLIEARKSAALTQEELASRLGVTQSEVSKFERGERGFDVFQLRAWIATGLGLPFPAFLQRFDEQLLGQEALRGLSRRS